MIRKMTKSKAAGDVHEVMDELEDEEADGQRGGHGRDRRALQQGRLQVRRHRPDQLGADELDVLVEDLPRPGHRLAGLRRPRHLRPRPQSPGLRLMRRVLITGASGFVGRHCLGHLAAGPWEVHAVLRRGDAPAPATTHRGDLLSAADVSAVLAAVRPSHLLHLAWVTTPGAYWTSTENLAWLGAGLHLLREFAAN